MNTKKLTVKEKVEQNAETLKAMTTHTQLREWAVANDMDNRAAFPRFKKELKAIGVDYDFLKMGIILEEKESLLSKLTHQVTLYSDAKASAGRYAVCDEDGEPVYYGRFFENEDATEQSRAELNAASKALFFATKVKEACNLEVLKVNLIVDAEWLTYQDHDKQKGYTLTKYARKHNLILEVSWISGKNNPADKYTIGSGYQKWSDNDLKTFAKEITKEN